MIPPADGLPAPADVADAVRRVLSRPEFQAPDSSWLEELFTSVAELFGSLSNWIDELLGGLGAGSFLQWVLIGWLVLSLLAIVTHLVWSLVRAERSVRQGRVVVGAAADAQTPTELLAQADQLALARRFEPAMHLLYLAALRFLDQQGQVRYAVAKTGGDYLGELAGEPARAWRRLLASFYPVAFGGRAASEDGWRAMRSAAGSTASLLPASAGEGAAA